MEIPQLPVRVAERGQAAPKSKLVAEPDSAQHDSVEVSSLHLRVLLAGPPGAGKTTQGLQLAKTYGVPDISVGALLREEESKGSEIGRKAQHYTDRGDLVPTEIFQEILSHRLEQPDAQQGFILDGAARRLDEVEMLDRISEKAHLPAIPMLFLDLPDAEILHRIEERRADAETHGGGETRADDDPATVKHRLEVFRAETQPVIALYAARGLLHTVPASGPLDVVTAAVMQAARELLDSH